MIVIYFNMIILPQLPLYAIAIICGLLSFLATRIVMPKIIRKMKEADIVGKDIHKSIKSVGILNLFCFILSFFKKLILFH